MAARAVEPDGGDPGQRDDRGHGHDPAHGAERVGGVGRARAGQGPAQVAHEEEYDPDERPEDQQPQRLVALRGAREGIAHRPAYASQGAPASTPTVTTTVSARKCQ